MSRIGYIGLGALGSAIFPNIVAYAAENRLPAPSVWNRSQDKYSALVSAHPEVYTAKEISEVVERSDIIFTCLVNDQAAEEVYDKLVAALAASPKPVVFADQTTLKASTAVKIKEKVTQTGGVYITNTVFGQPPAAKAKALVCVSAGDTKGREIVKPILEYIGKKVVDVGDDNAKGMSLLAPRHSSPLMVGAALKLLGNSILLGVIQLYGEVYALADAIGFDPKVFHELHRLCHPFRLQASVLFTHDRECLRCTCSAQLQQQDLAGQIWRRRLFTRNWPEGCVGHGHCCRWTR